LGAGIFALENDGFPNLSAVIAESLSRSAEEFILSVQDARLVFRSLGEDRFEELIEAGPGISDAHASRGCAFVDFGNDGDVNVLVMNINERPR
jgi:enediyne biosynthesis protein E4